MRGIRMPIRLKIVVTLLVAITAVVSVIVFAMANVFHEDKRTYISDLVSTTALSTAHECRAVLDGYRERVRIYSRIAVDHDLPSSEKAELLRSLFRDFPELVAIRQSWKGREVGSVVNTKELERAGLSAEELQRWARDHPAPADLVAQGRTVVENSTIRAALPTLTLHTEVLDEERGRSFVASAVIRLDELIELTTRSQVFDLYLAGADGTLLAHPDLERVAGRSPAELRPEVRDLGASGGESIAVEYVQDGTDFIAGFADTGLGGVVAAARIPKSAAYLASRDLLSRLADVALLLLAVGAVAGILWAAFITRPLDRLTRATREIAEGRFDVRVGVRSRDEIGELSAAFDRMADGLREREAALRSAQTQLVQSEKMAAFGQLGAGIAHEVKNPLSGILGCAQIALRKAEPGSMMQTNLQLIEKETKRCKAIIDNLLRFARQEKAAVEPTEINQVVEDAVAIVAHQLELSHVRLETDLAPGLPKVLGNANQLQQVVMNLMINGQQAMDGGGGHLSVLTRRNETGAVEIRVRDSGPGIPREHLDRIFEPFFTTKESGRGTGLGLSVSFGIVKDHGGEIMVESLVGRGTTFVVSLPVFAADRAPAEPEPAGVAV